MNLVASGEYYHCHWILLELEETISVKSYWQLELGEIISVKSESKYKSFLSRKWIWKCLLQDVVFFMPECVNHDFHIPQALTHWGRVTHICVSNFTIKGSDNGLSPGRCQAIIWTNAGTLLIRTLGTDSNEILSEIHAFLFKKMRMKMASAKWRPFRLRINVLEVHIITQQNISNFAALTCCVLATPYDTLEFGHHWFSWWSVVYSVLSQYISAAMLTNHQLDLPWHIGIGIKIQRETEFKSLKTILYSTNRQYPAKRALSAMCKHGR